MSQAAHLTAVPPLAQVADPTGLSTPLGQVVVLAALVSSVVVGLWALWSRRKR